MARPILTTALGALFFASTVGAQPPGAVPLPKNLPPAAGPRIGFPQMPPRPEDAELEDIRPLLAGKGINPKPKDVDPKVLKELMEKLNKMPKDQQPDKSQIEKMLKDNPAFKDPKFLEQLQKMLDDPNFPKNLEGKLPKDVPVPDQGEGAELKHKLDDIIKSGKQDAGDPEFGKDDLPKGDPKLPDVGKPPEAGPKNPYADNDWVKWMEKNFGNSEAGKDAVKDLLDSIQKGNTKGMFDDLPDFKNGGWNDLNKFGGPKGDDGWKIKPPDLSLSKDSGSGWSGGGSSSWGGSSGGSSLGGGGGGVGLGGGGGTALLVIVGIAAAIFIALMLFRRWNMDEARRAAQGAGGPVGIDFDSIHTREQLVQAFDHVSLDQIGEEARPWNHRVIADQFAETRPAQAAPATELAGLYERARYAPDDEDLASHEFADARRDLRVISGGPA